MTEKEWLTCSNIWELTDFLHERADERRLRLFAHACCSRLLGEEAEALYHGALEAVARRADGFCGEEELQATYARLLARVNEIESTLRDRGGIVVATQQYAAANAIMFSVSPRFTREEVSAGVTSTLGSLVFYVKSAVVTPTWERTRSREETDRVEKAELDYQLALLRDLFGNPFRPVVFSPEWRTDTAVSLATQMYESRDFSAMPILADALQDAGCDNTDILLHCRGEGPHVRGCWVVDLVLGKE